MELVYKTIVTSIGKKSFELIDQGMFVIFKDNAPDYLKEYCIMHNENNLLSDIKSEDILMIGEEKFIIASVGAAVNENLRNLGHITFKFNGDEEPLPGSLIMEKKQVPQLKEGMKIEIWR